jgi:hypothetical protein
MMLFTAVDVVVDVVVDGSAGPEDSVHVYVYVHGNDHEITTQ